MFETEFSSPIQRPRPAVPKALEPLRRGSDPPTFAVLRPLGSRAFFLLGFLYLYSFPYFERFRSAGELPRILLAQEIVERRTLTLDARRAELPAGAETVTGADGHLYASAAPGPSFLAAPVYAALKLVKATAMKSSTWAFRVFVVTIPALLFLPFFYRLSARFTGDEPARRAALVAYALGSTALPDATLFLPQQLAAVALGGAFFAAATVVRGETRHLKRSALLAGVLAGAAPWMDNLALFVAPLIGAYLVVRGRDRIRNLALFLLGSLPFVAALGLYQGRLYGTFLGALLLRGSFEPRRDSLAALLFDPGRGLLLLMPWVLLAAIGFGVTIASRTSRRRVGAEAVVALLAIAIYLAALSSATPSLARSGWSVGPRQLAPVLPFLGWLAASGFATAYRWLVTRTLAQALVVVSAVIFVAAASTFPHWPDALRNPLHELTFPLVRQGYGAPSLGTALGLPAWWALVPLYLVGFLLVGWMLSRGVRWGMVSTVAAFVLAGGLLHAYGRWLPATGPAADESWRFVTALWRPTPRTADEEQPAPAPAPAAVTPPPAPPPRPPADSVKSPLPRPAKPPRAVAAPRQPDLSQPVFTPGPSEPRSLRKRPPVRAKRRWKPENPEVELR